MRGIVLVVLAGAAILDSHAALGADAGAGDRRSHVVARVGSRQVTVGDLEDRLAQLAPFQRAGLGASADAIRRRFLTDVVIRDELLAQGAADEGLARRPPAEYQIERTLSEATVRSVRGSIGAPSTIPMNEVQEYFDRNRERYDTPERYHLWRILCKTREEARSVLDATLRDPTPTNFGTLAREHSVDKATNLRAGNLGFVTADGASNEPGLRVDPAIVRAVQGLRDGSLAPEPIAEGDYFSVVWRRGTVAATKRTVDDVAAQIRDTLWKARVKARTDELIGRLRAEKLRDLNAPLLSKFDLPAVDGSVMRATGSGGDSGDKP